MSELTKQISVIVWFKFNSNAEVLWLWVITIKTIQKHVPKIRFFSVHTERSRDLRWIDLNCYLMSCNISASYIANTVGVICIFHEGICVANFMSCGESVCIVWRRRWKQQDAIQHSGSFSFICVWSYSEHCCVCGGSWTFKHTFWVVTWQIVGVTTDWMTFILTIRVSCECCTMFCFMCVSLFCGVCEQ
jgi:hypothetical protein